MGIRNGETPFLRQDFAPLRTIWLCGTAMRPVADYGLRSIKTFTFLKVCQIFIKEIDIDDIKYEDAPHISHFFFSTCFANAGIYKTRCLKNEAQYRPEPRYIVYPVNRSALSSPDNVVIIYQSL